MIKYTDKYLVLILEDENGDWENKNSGKRYTILYTQNWVDAPNQQELDKWIEVENLDDVYKYYNQIYTTKYFSI